ncbi:STAS domain-containing protein [Nonomuraea sp. FMUSA5-5]|uniref:Anti-sigma factor antagonist n=1 Tax=Nonomuraea composti TaxID=2720023 RepID=A0ABX1B3F6_9ACTN|nr:STAS domain-containing protein [Nonomuraea sp. FMUSA5-5]NJP92370.1 STAS domain-containing protein [Nonomuraea sp. FMUSA5-5]
MSPLILSCRELPGGVLITVAGELDSSNSDKLQSYAERYCRLGAGMVLDLHGLTFLDSRGLHVLLRLQAAVRAQGGVLRLADVQELPARVLEITGVRQALVIEPDVRQAIAAMRERRPDDARLPGGR